MFRFRLLLAWLGFSICLFFIHAISTATLGAQVSAWPLDGPSFAAAPSEILAESAKIATEKFAPVTVLYEEEKQTLDAEQRVTNTHRLVYRIETQDGVDSWSEAAVEWEAFYQNEPNIHARVIRANGTIELDQKTITDVPARNESNGTYSDERIRKAPLPGLSVGAIVEEETTLVDKEPFFSDGGVYRNYFQRDVPIIRSRLIVELPLSLPFDYRVGFLPDLMIKKTEEAGIRRLVFDQGHLSPSLQSDINLATPVPRFPWVEFSTGKSWESVAAAYRRLSEPQISADQVKGMIADTHAADRLSTIQALVSKLHKEVRYTGIEFGQSKLQPQQPSEVLKRHYGDCKDKATLLVAMLRASGIPANVALLNAGPGRDVTPDLPGMNQFDHAIVYVPSGSSGEKALWIDATAEFTKVGALPYGDHGRLALIIAEGSHELTQTPEALPTDSVLIENREFELTDYGPSKAVELSQTSGYIDDEYRSEYGGGENKERKERLETYARNAYGAKVLDKIEHGDPKDFTKPFYLRLQMAKATRGNTAINDAAVVLYPTGTYSTLPRWFSIDPAADTRKLTGEEEADKQKAEQQRSSEYVVAPFICERRYKVTPPAGFLLRSLPTNKTTQMGPAILTQVYTVDGSGVVTAVLRFDSGKARYTSEEALALRKAVVDANKEDAVTVQYDQAGAKYLAAGKVRDGLAADRATIAAHPHDALPHIRMAMALLDSGVGDQARTEALTATTLDPKSALAYRVLGSTLEYSVIGVRFGSGFDRDGAIKNYKKSKELDPEDLLTRYFLAFIDEYDLNGVRYAAGADLKSAIEEYKGIKTQDPSVGDTYQDVILFDMLYGHEYKDLITQIDTLPATDVRNGLNLAATAATAGVDTAIKRADRISGDTQARSRALRNAGAQLINLRLYPEGAQILSASVQGQDDSTMVARQVEIFHDLHPYEQRSNDQATAPFANSTVVVERMMADSLMGHLTEADVTHWLSRRSFMTDKEWQADVKQNLTGSKSLLEVAQRAGLTPTVLADLSLGKMKISSQGDDQTGYRVTVQSIGSAGQQYFVAKEDDTYRVVAGQSDSSQVGTAALYFLNHGNETEARSLLDWKRDILHKGGGDDPLAGPLLPQFWTSGESKGPENIQLAAASLLTNSQEFASVAPSIAAIREKWISEGVKPEKLDELNLLLAEGYDRLGDAANAKKMGELVVKDFPESVTAMQVAGAAYGMNHDWAAWNSMLDGQLAKHPSDRDLLYLKARAAQEAGDFTSARKTLRILLDSGKANSSDYNNYGWNSLFENTVNEDALQAAQQANMLSKNSSFNDLHTLSCLYAAQGKTIEAKQVLFQAMAAGNLAEPNGPAWYAFGAIYEQYGVFDAAMSAFEKVEKPEGPIGATDTYLLAQEHLKSLRDKKHANGTN